MHIDQKGKAWGELWDEVKSPGLFYASTCKLKDIESRKKTVYMEAMREG